MWGMLQELAGDQDMWLVFHILTEKSVNLKAVMRYQMLGSFSMERNAFRYRNFLNGTENLKYLFFDYSC